MYNVLLVFCLLACLPAILHIALYCLIDQLFQVEKKILERNVRLLMPHFLILFSCYVEGEGSLQDDDCILKVIEAYCYSARMKTVASCKIFLLCLY